MNAARRTLLALSLGLIVATAVAADAPPASPVARNWVEGQHYFRLSPTQATNLPRGKLALTEVFSYGCIACNQFQPYMQQLRKQLPANVVLSYLPASWIATEDWPMLQRAYLTARTMGIADKTHDDMFAAIWSTGELALADPVTHAPKTRLPTLEDAANFYARKSAASVKDFLSTAHSFLVEFSINQTDQQIKAMRVESTPTLIVNGKYRIDARSAGGFAKLNEVALWLMAQENKASP